MLLTALSVTFPTRFGLLCKLRSPEQHPLLCFIDHARIPQLLNVVHLLAKDCHGGTVALDGLEPLWGLDLPLHDEGPHLSALLHQLPQQGVRHFMVSEPAYLPQYKDCYDSLNDNSSNNGINSTLYGLGASIPATVQ